MFGMKLRLETERVLLINQRRNYISIRQGNGFLAAISLAVYPHTAAACHAQHKPVTFDVKLKMPS